MSTTGVLLAAGAGRRFGSPKALVRHDGALFVETATATLTRAGCSPVVVVLGASATEVRERASLPHALVLDNPDWPTGMGSSLRVALTAVMTGDNTTDAILVLPVDTPGITVEAVRRLSALATPDALARASFHGEPGHPVLIGRDHWAGVLETSTGDAGARDYLRAHPIRLVPCEDVADGADVDRPEDLGHFSRIRVRDSRA
ncbi:nucleotidyltransferase family protein [Umezawaea tangerina]|uniref:Nicotine blue oxidoreductase n=1 Tax=Umezawaea tangerina TaxID=84725 RepID=A0A2T0SUW9_9PSEU|nr:nucleotidyltransferase family protein [Umezawaea tangerina]PRY37211.1 nicotine blue oxidoreductase [Umezawaea tangerina]